MVTEEGGSSNMSRMASVKKISGLLIGSSLVLVGLLPATAALAASPATVTLTQAQKAPTLGGSDTFTAASTNIANPEYQFWVEKGNTWSVAQNWSKANTVSLKNMTDGSYLVTVYAAPRGNFSKPVNTAPDGDIAVVSAFVGSAVTVSGPATVTQGKVVTLTAGSTNISPVLYQFWYESPDGTWTSSGNYGNSSTYSFTASAAGPYHFIAYAKMPDAINDAQGAGYSAVSVTQSTAPTTSPTTSPTIQAAIPSGAVVSGTPTSITASFDQNGTLIASENVPVSDYSTSTKSVSFAPPSSLAAGTYTVTVLFEMSNANFIASPTQTYTQG